MQIVDEAKITKPIAPFIEKREPIPFWQSKTIWVNVIAIIAFGVQQFTGFVIDESIQVQLLAVINLILRAVTSKSISLT